MVTTVFFGLLRAIHAATLNHTAKRRPDHIQQPTDWRRQALQHRPRLKQAPAWQDARCLVVDASPPWQSTVGRVSPEAAIGICDCNPVEEPAARPTPDVQEQPQHHLSSSR